MPDIQDYVLMSGAYSTMVVGVAVLVALVYLYVTVRLRGTLFLLMWKSPVMALGAYLYLRSAWRWPKSLAIWLPFGSLGVAYEFVFPQWRGQWANYLMSHPTAMFGMSAGSLIAFTGYVTGLITSGLLLLAVIFLIQDFLHLRRQPRNLDEKLAAASEGLQ